MKESRKDIPNKFIVTSSFFCFCCAFNILLVYSLVRFQSDATTISLQEALVTLCSTGVWLRRQISCPSVESVFAGQRVVLPQ